MRQTHRERKRETEVERAWGLERTDPGGWPDLQREGKKIMTTPRLILSFIFFFFNDTQKPMDVFTVCFFRFVFVFIYYFSLRCLVECVYRSALRRFLYFFFFFFYMYIYFCPFVSLRQWYAAPITEEKMSHHGQVSYGFIIRYCALGKKSSLVSFFLFRFFFFFFYFGSLSVTSWFAGRADRGWK